jgi:hypothetical protein
VNPAHATPPPGSIEELIQLVREEAEAAIRQSGWGDSHIAEIRNTARVPDPRRPRDKLAPRSFGGYEAMHAARALRAADRAELAWREGRPADAVQAAYFADAVKAAYQAGHALGNIAASVEAREKGTSGAKLTALHKRQRSERFLAAAAVVECEMARKLGRQPSNKEIWCATAKVGRRKDGLTYQTFCRHWAQRRKDSQ